MPLNLDAYIPSFNAAVPQEMPALSFQEAILNGKVKMVEELLKTDSSLVESILPNGEPALVFAIRQGKVDLVKILLGSKKADFTQRDDQGLTPVDHAVIAGDKAILATVLTHQIGQNIQNAQDLINSNPQCLKASLELDQRLQKLKTLDVSFLPELHRAAYEGDLEKFKKYAAFETDLNRTSLQGRTPLHYAALAGKREMVEFLLNAGADATVTNLEQESVLHLAVLKPNTGVLPLLLQKKLEINQVDKQGYTPLHFAMAEESLNDAKSLIENGADLLCNSRTGLTPLAVLVGIVHRRGAKRDPMKINLLQTLMFASIVCSWCTAYFSHSDPYFLATAGAVLTQFTPLMMLLKSSKSYAEMAVNIVGEAIAANIPGVSIIYSAYKSWHVTKAALESLRTCWRNSGYEQLRPLRNGIISAVNLTHSTMNIASSIKTVVNSTSSFIGLLTQSNMLSRRSKFISACLNTKTSLFTCHSEFLKLEAIRLGHGIPWELGADGIEERFRLFSPICSKELQDAEKCQNLFWLFENNRYLEDVKWESFFSSNLIGRTERWNRFNNETRITKVDFKDFFEVFENLRYLNSIQWENGIDGFSNRYEALQAVCRLTEESEKNCMENFLNLEFMRCQGLFWEKQLIGAGERWKAFKSICQNEFASMTSGNPQLCNQLFTSLENKRYINGIEWDKEWQESFKNSSLRLQQFQPECEKLGEITCQSKFIDFETDRIIKRSIQEPSFSGMKERLEAIKSTGLETSESDFWNLEKGRANLNEKWEENIAGSAERRQNFDLLCKKSLNGINLKNTKRCDHLFKAVELGRWKTGKRWEERLEENTATVSTRWNDFNSACLKLRLVSENCEKIFWEKMEPLFYSDGLQLKNLDELNDVFKAYKKACEINQLSAYCEKESWDYLISRMQNELGLEPKECDSITPAELFNKTSAEIIANDRLNPNCKQHAAIILGLKEGWGSSECKQRYRELMKQFHPDKYLADENKAQKISDKLNVAKKTLCSKSKHFSNQMRSQEAKSDPNTSKPRLISGSK